MDNTSEGKNINEIALKSGSWYVFSSIILNAISLISTPIFTRLLTTEEFGYFSAYASWVNLLVVFFTLNLTFSIGRAKIDYSDKLDSYIGSIQLLSILINIVLSSVLCFFSVFFSSILELPVVAVWILAVQLFATPIVEFYQNGARYRYKYKQNIAIGWFIGISTILLSLLLIYVFDYDRGVLRMIGGAAPVVIVAIVLLALSVRDGVLKVNLEYWKYGLFLSLPMVAHTLSLRVLSQADRLFIQRICGPSTTAIYSVAYNIGGLLTIVSGSIANGWLPWFHDKYHLKQFDEIKKNTKLLVVFLCYVCLAAIDLAPEIVTVYGGSKYISGVYCIAPVSLGVLCQTVYTHYVNIELHLKKTRYVPIGTMIAAVINVILNAVFIPKYGYVAAAYTTYVSYLALLVIHFCVTRFKLKVKLYDDLFMFGSLVVTTVVAGGLVLTYKHNVIRFLLLGIGFSSFVFVFRSFIGNWITKHKKAGK